MNYNIGDLIIVYDNPQTIINVGYFIVSKHNKWKVKWICKPNWDSKMIPESFWALEDNGMLYEIKSVCCHNSIEE